MIPLDCHTLYEDAELYDQEFCDRDFEIPFYRRQALASGGPVLELACGSGRLTFPIAAAGVEIAGVDISPEMIEQARKRSAPQAVSIDWHIQDIRKMSLGRRFHMASLQRTRCSICTTWNPFWRSSSVRGIISKPMAF